MSRAERGVVTLATGKPVYVSMAVNLARSFRRWHRDGRISFAIATDQPEAIPGDIGFAHVISLAPRQFGSGFSPKLHLDRFAPAAHTLFVDSDCLCVGPLDGVFDRFAGRAVSVVGRDVAGGEWFGDVSAVCRAIGVPRLPKFNGGVYYAEPGAVCSQVYDTARDLEARYDELGLLRLRGHPNDEVLIACAMALHGLEPITDDGTILSDPQACPVVAEVDALRGRATLFNPPPPHPLHRSWHPIQVAHPALVHFLGSFAQQYPYTREALRLELVEARDWPIVCADVAAAALRSLPSESSRLMRRVLRPAYRRVFGTRPVAPSPRL